MLDPKTLTPEQLYNLQSDTWAQGAEYERERIIKNIRSRVVDLRSCHKNDNCQEFATLIESYIEEWTEGGQK